MASDILIVDDEADIRDLVAGILEDEGHETRIAGNSDAALASIADRVPRLIFLDIWLQEAGSTGWTCSKPSRRSIRKFRL